MASASTRTPGMLAGVARAAGSRPTHGTLYKAPAAKPTSPHVAPRGTGGSWTASIFQLPTAAGQSAAGVTSVSSDALCTTAGASGSAGCAAGPRALGPAAPAAACALGARRPELCRVLAGAWSAPSCSGAGAMRCATVATGACHRTCQPRGSPFRPVVVSRACVSHTVQLVCTSHIPSRSTTVKSGSRPARDGL